MVSLLMRVVVVFFRCSDPPRDEYTRRKTKCSIIGAFVSSTAVWSNMRRRIVLFRLSSSCCIVKTLYASNVRALIARKSEANLCVFFLSFSRRLEC